MGKKKSELENNSPTKKSFFKEFIKFVFSVISVWLAIYPFFPHIEVEPMSEKLEAQNLFTRPLAVKNTAILFKAYEIKYSCSIINAKTSTNVAIKGFLTTDEKILSDLPATESTTAFCTFPFNIPGGEVNEAKINFIIEYKLFFSRHKKIFRYTVRKNTDEVDVWMPRATSEK